MKKIFLSAMLCAASGLLWAQNEPYYGGYGDGNGNIDLIQYSMSDPAQLYAFYGGNGDGNTGFDLILYNHTNPPQSYAFYGGNGDGNSSIDLLPYNHTNPPQFYAFFGGDGDGNSNLDVTPYNHVNPPQFYAFFGGNGDGFAGDLLLMYIPPLLPVHLLSFEGKAVGDDGLLEWKVSDEADIIRYELQRSTSGNDFKHLYTEEVKTPSSAEKTYNYTDTAPEEGSNYYRLQFTNKQGKNEYSPTVLLNFDKDKQSLTIYPNPARQTLMMSYNYRIAATMRIVDVKGSIIRQQVLEAGAHTISIPVDELSQGMYILQVNNTEGYNQSIRFVKQ